MSDARQRLIDFTAFIEQTPAHVAKALNAVVYRNVEEYLDSLNDISPEEEIRMITRWSPVQEQNTNELYRERLLTFKTKNKEFIQKFGEAAFAQDVLENPLKAALVDESIMQLFLMADQISSAIKAQKIDGPSLVAIAEKAVTLAIRDDGLPEIKRKMTELVDSAAKKAAHEFIKELQPDLSRYVAELVSPVSND